MSTATAEKGTRPTPAPAERLHGLYWLAWRQNRLLVCTVVAVAALGSAWFARQHVDLADILSRVPRPDDLGPSGRLYSTYAKPAVVLLPLLVGMFVGAPLFAQEHERGTLRLVWCQSVSRSRWLAARLAVPAVALAAGTGVLAGFCTWYVRLGMRGGLLGESPFESYDFQTIGLLPVALVLFAFALGAVVGMLVRRTLPAVIATGALLLGVQTGLVFAQPYFYPSSYRTQVNPVGDTVVTLPDHAWQLSVGTVPHHPDTSYTYYHPISHLVPMQLVESGLLLVLTAGLVALAFRLVRRIAA